MPEHRRKFSPQVKAEAVRVVIETGGPMAEVEPQRRPQTCRGGSQGVAMRAVMTCHVIPLMPGAADLCITTCTTTQQARTNAYASNRHDRNRLRSPPARRAPAHGTG